MRPIRSKLSDERRRQIWRLAQEILDAFEIEKLPVDPLYIANEEGIALAPGSYGEGFDARLEHYGDDLFAIFYKSDGWSPGRQRFSIAHELGHFYLAEHRQVLRAGLFHDSEVDFRSTQGIEREADEFAAALLMPMRQFTTAVRRHSQGVCNLRELVTLANEVFLTSVTSTVLRYVGYNFEPCAVVQSTEGRVDWAFHSEDMRALGMGYVPKGAVVPPQSVTALARDGGSPAGRAVPPEVWYERPRADALWEECIPLGSEGRVITFLTADPESD